MSGSSMRASVSVAGLVTAHRVTVSGLQQRTRYSYSVRSTDAAGNATVSPVYTFTTRK